MSSGNEGLYGPLSSLSYQQFWVIGLANGWDAVPPSNWTGSGFTGAPPYAGLSSVGRMGLSTKSVSNSATSGSSNEMDVNKSHVIYSTPFAGGVSNDTGIIDLTDQAGHGIIFAGQNIYLSAAYTTVTTAAETFKARVLFRWKNVSLKEYIGVVTSQLSA